MSDEISLLFLPCGPTHDLIRTAAELRADHKLPYTDCFAAALAAQRKASLATSDQDFATVEKKIDILSTIA